MRSIAAVMVVTGVVAAPRVAAACSCLGAFTFPWSGAEGVARNVRLVIAVAEGLEYGQLELRRAADGAAVACEFEVREGEYANVGRVYYGTPVEALEAGTEYEVHAVGAGGGGFVAMRFSTGDAIDETAPAAAGAALRVQRLRAVDECASSCWSRRPGTDLYSIEHEALPADAAYAVIEYGPEGEAPTVILRPVWAAGSSATTVTSDSCDQPFMPELEEGRTYCARVRMVDAAGNVGPATEEMCAAAETCAIRDCGHEWDPSSCEPLPEEIGSGGEGGASADAGAAGCAASTRHGGGLAGLVLLVAALVSRRRRAGGAR